MKDIYITAAQCTHCQTVVQNPGFRSSSLFFILYLHDHCPGCGTAIKRDMMKPVSGEPFVLTALKIAPAVWWKPWTWGKTRLEAVCGAERSFEIL